MIYDKIVKAVEKLMNKYREHDPFKLCQAMGIKLIYSSLGTANDAIKGFFLESKRIMTITINTDLPQIMQKFIVCHELGHAVLHRKSGIHAFHEVGLFDESSIYEKEANLFAAELLLEDDEVMQTLNEDNTFFSAVAILRVPIELLDFKFRIMKRKGYKLTEPPIIAESNFLRDIEVPYGADEYIC